MDKFKMTIVAVFVALHVFSSIGLAGGQVGVDANSKSDEVVVFELAGEIMLDIETTAFEAALGQVAKRKPLFILLEIDTPGGRTDLAKRICAAITEVKDCKVIAFIRGGKYGGAISAGAAVAFACDEIYMVDNATIGAATVIAMSKSGRPEELKKAYGQEIGEKFSSAWRAYLASLAEKNQRCGLLARAMVDKDIEVVEVREQNSLSRAFIEPVNKQPSQKVVHTWSKKGSLLTLTAGEAVKCGAADKLIESREKLLADLGAKNAKVVVNKEMQKAHTEFDRAHGQLKRIRKSIDFKIKQSKDPLPAAQVLKILRQARSEFKRLIQLGKKYPDLNLNIQGLEDELNSVEAGYQSIKRQSKRR
ncbi:MAG: hypothetical protein ACYST9_05045 [Planctomycetota bacterium]|jgi:ClpP class serine protease